MSCARRPSATARATWTGSSCCLFESGRYTVIAEGGELAALATPTSDSRASAISQAPTRSRAKAPVNSSKITYSYNAAGAMQRVAAKSADAHRTGKSTKARYRDAVSGRFVKGQTSGKKADITAVERRAKPSSAPKGTGKR